ncbi:MAG: hypothetical protein DWQ31_12850 [Planctomycetota bacterium]|nr:MAG: hypothetical protein DWQ31_12850 [Planctomycetota bacterium]REJ91813.1 MAG: hypothetical protein DWQ35_14010 [Planctomycetota bacterium]REK25941.1 MAG: hypothetical protein DWQ42_09940 [Planctomycetota bacterium]REK46942.1 MAG: hypothetical protein DWQ46_05455 [Planctomycetota bacterium]
MTTLTVLRDSSASLTHAAVSARLTEHGVDQATVFRNLRHLVTANLVRRSEIGDHVWRFEIITQSVSRIGVASLAWARQVWPPDRSRRIGRFVDAGRRSQAQP